jgi:hypothetical protein
MLFCGNYNSTMAIQNQFKPKTQFFKNTFCVFEAVDSTIVENLEPNFISDSGSQYFYTEEGLYRLSNHWGRLGNCKWRLIASEIENLSKTKLGYASWDSFYPDNNIEELYYLEVDYTQKKVMYQHKNNPDYDGKTPLRTAQETTKRIKQIRNLLELTNWAKYFENQNIEELRVLIIEDLVFSRKTLEEIKAFVKENESSDSKLTPKVSFLKGSFTSESDFDYKEKKIKVITNKYLK